MKGGRQFMNTILPIGSVVMLKNATKPLMVFGYLQESALFPGQYADYIGVPYPEGNLNLATQIGFQMTDIDKVLFEGYRTAEFEPYAQLLELNAKRHGNES
jgi:hypothetical protein